MKDIIILILGWLLGMISSLTVPFIIDRFRKKTKKEEIEKGINNELYNSKEFKSTLFNRKHKNTMLQEQVESIRILLIEFVNAKHASR